MKTRPLILFIPILLLFAGLLSIGPASGSPTPDEPRTPVAEAPPAGTQMREPSHTQAAPVPVSKRPPRSAPDATRRSYDAAPAAPAGCNVEDFANSSGDTLVELIKSSALECINTLFSVTGDNARALFQESQMVSVADAFGQNAGGYPGDNSTSTAQLVLYLRAGYYVQYYNPDVVGPYGPDLEAATHAGLDAFFGNPNSQLVSEENGATLSEAVILIDSAAQNARFLRVVERLLTDYNPEYDQHWSMVNAVNNVYTILFRGHQLPEFVEAVEADPGVLDTLHGFAVEHLDLLGTDRRYLTSNAGRELGRFLQHEQFHGTVRPQARDLLGRSDMVGQTAPLWVGVAEMADAYDQANCEYYDVCDLQQRLQDAVLTIGHTCGEGLGIKAQQLTSDELATSCDSMRGQTTYFHDLIEDNGPVPDDKNETLEVVVFDTSADYQTYGGAIYGVDTNNGGIYLEGDPSADGNLPRFIAYEAEWLPSFEIWNLNHEYTHYLDGRYNMYGDFNDNIETPTVWWLEGFAEYVSYSYRDITNDDAVAEAGKGTYNLSELFDTTYSHDTVRVYPWGYLAVRFMVENHRGDIDTVLGFYRSGDWGAARQHLESTIGTGYDQAWRDWLTELRRT